MILDQKHLFFTNYNSDFYKYNNDLYKIIKRYINERLENQIVYNHLINKEVSPNIILPTQLVYNTNDWLIGYKMNFVDGTRLDNMINKKVLSFVEKIFITNELFDLLKEIHNYLVVGDIRNSNILIGKDSHPYLIDFDFSTTIESSATPWCKYFIYKENERITDQSGDIIKMLISVLSLLYDYNLEDLIHDEYELENLEGLIPPNGYFKEYYYYLVDKINKHDFINYYFNLPLIDYNNIEKEINTGKSRILMK